jgi:hypothetical protein
MRTANFSVTIHRQRFTFLAVTDLNLAGYPSVTNDIENVLTELVAAGLLVTGRLVIYRDSLGIWDQVLIDDACRFANFRSLNARSAAEAISIVVERGQ